MARKQREPRSDLKKVEEARVKDVLRAPYDDSTVAVLGVRDNGGAPRSQYDNSGLFISHPRGQSQVESQMQASHYSNVVDVVVPREGAQYDEFLDQNRLDALNRQVIDHRAEQEKRKEEDAKKEGREKRVVQYDKYLGPVAPINDVIVVPNNHGPNYVDFIVK